MRLCRLILLLVPVLLALQSPAAAAKQLNIFVAASLTDVATEFARSFENEFDVSVRIVPAATSTLARQIAAGAPADIFLSANQDWIDWLTERNIGQAHQTRIFAGNSLVVVTAAGKGAEAGNIDEILAPGGRARIALADPEHVPAGRYAKQVLESGGQWQNISGRLLPAANVRDALRYAETGQTAFSIVYASDADAEGVTVDVVAHLPDPRPPIRYLALPVGGHAEVQRFMNYLGAGQADAVLCRHGFRLPEGRAC